MQDEGSGFHTLYIQHLICGVGLVILSQLAHVWCGIGISIIRLSISKVYARLENKIRISPQLAQILHKLKPDFVIDITCKFAYMYAYFA